MLPSYFPEYSHVYCSSWPPPFLLLLVPICLQPYSSCLSLPLPSPPRLPPLFLSLLLLFLISLPPLLHPLLPPHSNPPHTVSAPLLASSSSFHPSSSIFCSSSWSVFPPAQHHPLFLTPPPPPPPPNRWVWNVRQYHLYVTRHCIIQGLISSYSTNHLSSFVNTMQRCQLPVCFLAQNYFTEASFWGAKSTDLFANRNR